MLVALYVERGDLHAIFTRRRRDLRSHPGEISFPGGRRDEGEGLAGDRAARGRGGDRPGTRGGTAARSARAGADDRHELRRLSVRRADRGRRHVDAVRERGRRGARAAPARTCAPPARGGASRIAASRFAPTSTTSATERVIWGATARIVGDLLGRLRPVLDAGAGALSAAMDRDGLLSSLATRVRDERVLAAVAAVPRELFVSSSLASAAYNDAPLRIGLGQTISQPTIVARMCELLELRPTDRVLDVGTGSGYHAAVLSRLCDHVWGVELHEQLARRAARTLLQAGIDNVTVTVGDGAAGPAGARAVRRDQRRGDGGRRGPAGARAAARAGRAARRADRRRARRAPRARPPPRGRLRALAAGGRALRPARLTDRRNRRGPFPALHPSGEACTMRQMVPAIVGAKSIGLGRSRARRSTRS